MILRPYQTDGIEVVRGDMRRGARRVLMVLPTGGGKTVIAAAIIASAIKRGSRVLFLAHRRELIAQCRAKLVDAGIAPHDVGVILAGTRPDPAAPVQVASVQTLIRRVRPPADLVFVDEAHHGRAASYARILADYPAARVVGLTATPCRADGAGLGDCFDALRVVTSFRALAVDGHLVEPRVFTGATADLKQIATTAGDFDGAQLGAAMNAYALVDNLTSSWERFAGGRSTVVFASSVEHSQSIAAAFSERGVAAEHLDGTTPTPERDAILSRVASGETLVVANMGVLTEGWDLPRVKCVVLARPTKSLALYMQMAGRGLRPWEGVGAILLDHGECIARHGWPSDDREWTLDGKKKQTPATPVKTCQRCFSCLPSAARVCPYCDHIFVAQARIVVEGERGELVEVERPSDAPKDRRAWYSAAVAEAFARGRKVGFARHRYRERYGTWPSFYAVEESAGYGDA